MFICSLGKWIVVFLSAVNQDREIGKENRDRYMINNCNNTKDCVDILDQRCAECSISRSKPMKYLHGEPVINLSG